MDPQVSQQISQLGFYSAIYLGIAGGIAGVNFASPSLGADGTASCPPGFGFVSVRPQ